MSAGISFTAERTVAQHLFGSGYAKVCARYLCPVLLAIAAVLFINLQGCRPAEKQYSQITAFTPAESAAVSNKVKLLVKELGYDDKVAKDFTKMVNSWNDKKQRPILVAYRQILNQATEDKTYGRMSEDKLSKIEQHIAIKLTEQIKKAITYDKEFFELSDVVKHRQAQCLGYSQLFYILGSAAGLTVKPINVVELETAQPEIAGAVHACCMVELANGKVLMADLVPGGSVSMPFTFERQFVESGNYWQLSDKSNPLKLDKKIQILDRNGLMAQIANNRASIHLDTGRYNDALFGFTEAIAILPTYAGAYNNRAIVYSRLGRYGRAVSDYDKAIELNPGHIQAYYNRGVAYTKLGKYTKAIADFTRAIELNPNHIQAYNNRGVAYRKLGQFDFAIADYDRAIKLDSHHAKAYGNRGISYALLGKTEKAKNDLLRVVELNPGLEVNVRKAAEYLQLNLDTEKPALLAAR